MTAPRELEPQRVRGLTDAIIDHVRGANDDIGLTVVMGPEAAGALAEESQEAPPAASGRYRGAALAVVPGLRRWLVMVVPMISALAPEAVDPATFYGDLRTSTYASALPPQA